MVSLKKNILYNSIRVGSNLVFPLVTFPYVTRIMGPESLGLYNYVSAIVAYFTLFACLGFPLYGTREVAQAKDNPEKMQSVTNAIFTSSVLACLTVYLMYFVVSLFLANNSDEFWIYTVLGFSIILSCISFDWFYQGIEDFKFITIRSLIIKIISIVCLFLFVKSKDDILYYAILTIAGTCGNNIWNLIRINRYIKLKVSFQDCWKHTSGAMTFFLGSIIVSLYTNLNGVMVGALGTMSAVAYFTTGNKIVNLAMTILGAVASSIMPRMSFLLKKGDENSALALQKRTLNLLYYIAFPLTVGMIVLAHPLILLFGGDKFIPAVLVMQILAPLLLVIVLSQFLSNQILIPLHLEKYNNYCVLGGALVNFVLNFILIPIYAEVGVAVTVLISESVVTLLFFIFASKHMKLTVMDFLPIKCMLSSAIMGLVIYCLFDETSHILCIFGYILLGATIYSLSLFVMKDKFFSYMLTIIKKKRNGK